MFGVAVLDGKSLRLIPKNRTGNGYKNGVFHRIRPSGARSFDRGYTRVYYQISDMYGSARAVRLMRNFHKELLKGFSFLDKQAILFGFSLGGLYAFNYALYYPESVSEIYCAQFEKLTDQRQ